MADKEPVLCCETGTYATAGPAVSLSGSAANLGSYPARTFAQAAADLDTDFADGNSCTVTISNGADAWAAYTGAVWSDLAPDTIDLSAATKKGSEGTLSNGAAVTVFSSLSIGTLTGQVIAALEAAGRLLPASATEGDILIYTGGAWTATDTLPIA